MESVSSSPVVIPLVNPVMWRPGWFWLSHVVPTLLILFSGQYAYSIAEGDMSPDERWASLGEGAVLAVVALISGGIALHHQARGWLLSKKLCWALLLMSTAVLGAGMFFALETLPSQIPDWIISQEELLYRLFCLSSLGVFYPAALLAAFPARRNPIWEIGRVLLLGLLGGGGVFVFIYGVGSLGIWRFLGHLPTWLGVSLNFLIIYAGGLLFSAAVIRLALLAYTMIRRWSPIVLMVFMFAIGIAAPLGGLMLNSSVPFPVDFQAPVVYLLTLINGAVLMLPVLRSIVWHRVIWLAQCALFPFSAYFFIVFLPWLPATPLAMMLMGAGALMLAPLVLGIVHGYRIIDGFREEIRDGDVWTPALLGILAVSVLPAALGFTMLQDRQALNGALTYIYSPDYRKDATFPGNLGRLESSLQHLRNMKHGIFLPFISPTYNAVVFHNLVLPDTKINFLQQAFFGPVTEQQAQRQQAGSMFSMREGNFWGGATSEKPPTGVVLKDVQVASQTSGAVASSRVTVVMENPTDVQSEFVGTIQIPEGVYVSDFGLYIGDQLVPARIVEKKTAQWVYTKITVLERRDPSILIYKSRTELELRVFPFAKGEQRKVEIGLTYPASGTTSIQIGEKTVRLDSNPVPVEPVLNSCTTPVGSIAVAEGSDLPAQGIKRSPYLHILIDCSQGSGYSREGLGASLEQAQRAFPEATLARVSAVNYEVKDIVADLRPVGQLDSGTVLESLLPIRGGFLEDRFLKRGLLQADDLLQKGGTPTMLRPQFVIISSQSRDSLREGGLDSFLRLAPDARVIYSQRTSEHRDMITHQAVKAPEPTPVLLWQWGKGYALTLTGPRAAALFSGQREGAPLLYSPATAQFAPWGATTLIPADSHFAEGVETWAAQDEVMQNPSLIQDGAATLIGLSKRTRILIPDSSFIAVESLAQWRILEEKEKLKLKSNQAFEHEENSAAVPEPTATWMLVAVGLALLWRNRKRLVLFG